MKIIEKTAKYKNMCVTMSSKMYKTATLLIIIAYRVTLLTLALGVFAIKKLYTAISTSLLN